MDRIYVNFGEIEGERVLDITIYGLNLFQLEREIEVDGRNLDGQNLCQQYINLPSLIILFYFEFGGTIFFYFSCCLSNHKEFYDQVDFVGYIAKRQPSI